MMEMMEGKPDAGRYQRAITPSDLHDGCRWKDEGMSGRGKEEVKLRSGSSAVDGSSKEAGE